MSRNSELVPRRAVELPLPLLGVLPGLLAVLAADGERQRTKALFRDLLAAVEAVAVIALLETHERVVDLVERLGLHLDERELDVFLDVGFGALDGVEHFVELAAPGAFFAHAAHLALHFGLDFATPLVEHLLQFGIASPDISAVALPSACSS